MNRNHQSKNTLHHTSHGRENIARKQMGNSMRTPTSFNPKELQRRSNQRSNPNQDFDELNNNSIDDFSGNYYERSYQGWMSHTDEDMMNNSNYRSDGPGPVEIEAREKYTHKHLYNPVPDLHNKTFSYRVQAEMDDVRNNETFIQSSRGTFGGIGPKGYTRSDDRIEEEVCEILARDRDIDASSIYVGVENGIVKLTGSVRNRQEKFAIEDAVENVSGIKEVKNDIKVQKNYNVISYDF